MTREQRRATRERFGFACGYYGASETLSGSSLTIDHFQPVSRGGRDEESNWVACCHACNEFKGAYWPTAEQHALLQPGQDEESEHLRLLSSGELEGLTPRGAFHIERLHLNRPELLAHRALVRSVEQLRTEREQLLEQLRVVDEQVRELRGQIRP